MRVADAGGKQSVHPLNAALKWTAGKSGSM